MAQPENPFGTYVSYRDNNSYTTERGSSKFIRSIIKTGSLGFGDSGAVINGFEITQKEPSPDMAVIINPTSATDSQSDGHCLVDFNDYTFMCWLTAPYELRIDTSSSLYSRISYIVAFVDRSVIYEKEDEVIESPSILQFIEVPGIPASSPVPPTTADIKDTVGQGNPYIILAKILVPVAATAIEDGDIEDKRIMAGIDDSIFSNSGSDNELFSYGVFQPNLAQTKTKIIVTEANASTPSAIDGVQLIWLRKQA